MQISVIEGVQNAEDARGLCVVIDVFRAFTTVCYAFKQGAEKIIPVRTIEEAFQMKQINPEWLLMGEEEGSKPTGFDLSNSPSEVVQNTLTKKTLVHRSSLGTQGLLQAINADEVITGSFVNFSAVTNYILAKNPDTVSLLATGSFDSSIIDEDKLCAIALKDYLEKNIYPDNVTELLKKSRWSNNFFDENILSHPIEDFALCADIDRFNFVVSLNRSKEVPYLFALKRS